MKKLGIFVVAMAILAVAPEGKEKKIEKFTPEFLEMLQSVLARLKVNKSDLSKLGVQTDNSDESTEPEETPASSTTTAPTLPPVVQQGTGESYCEKQSPETFQSYCKDARMQAGTYVDPWDPYCGFIECDQEGNATRHTCEKGSWTGFKATSQGRQAMCRRPLKLTQSGSCNMNYYMPEMCRQAEWVVDYNRVNKI